MAEIVDVMASVAVDARSNYRLWSQGQGMKLRRNLLCLAVGKVVGLATNWVILFMLLDESSPYFWERNDRLALVSIALGFTFVGCAIEGFASVEKVSLHRRVEEDALRRLSSLRLNRCLAWPRFIFNDGPASALGIYVIFTGLGSTNFGGAPFAISSESCETKKRTIFYRTASSPEPIMKVEETTTCSRAWSPFAFTLAAAALVVVSVGYSLIAMEYYGRAKARRPRRSCETRFDHVLVRMDRHAMVRGYRRQPHELPPSIDALHRVFRAALWAVRMKPRARERRLAALAAMRNLQPDIKRKILCMANLLRDESRHHGVRWTERACDVATGRPPQRLLFPLSLLAFDDAILEGQDAAVTDELAALFS